MLAGYQLNELFLRDTRISFSTQKISPSSSSSSSTFKDELDGMNRTKWRQSNVIELQHCASLLSMP